MESIALVNIDRLDYLIRSTKDDKAIAGDIRLERYKPIRFIEEGIFPYHQALAIPFHCRNCLKLGLRLAR